MPVRTLLIATVSTLVFTPAFAQEAAAPANPNAPVTRAELPALVREALIKNPDMLTDAIKVMQERQAETAQKETQAALATRQDDLFKDTVSPSMGPRDADVTVVEFFDYHCGYCKHLVPSITRLLKEDKKVRVVFREFPILSQDSVLASRAAVAVHRVAPDKYFAFHTELMKASGKFDEKMLTDLARKLGVDAKKFKDALEDKETTEQLDRNRELAEALGIRGTPALVFKDRMLPGAVPFEQLQKLVDDQRHGIKDPAPKGKDAAEPAPAGK